MKKKILIVFIVLSILLTAGGIRKMWLIDSISGYRLGIQGDKLIVVTWVDPQTGVEYLIFEDMYGGHRRGGLGLSVIPRLNSDGSLRIVK